MCIALLTRRERSQSVSQKKEKEEKKQKKSVRFRGRWASVGGLVGSMSIKEGFEVCFEDLFQRCDAASLGELVGEFRSGGPLSRCCEVEGSCRCRAGRC